ncbi:cache domain-containing sensor histidine kinase [Paenibacillus donghaensis]|nr:sensor histidine kinase [Paenibacillus donghaensis]
MWRSMESGWKLLAGLLQGMVAARKWLLAYVLLILLPASIMLASFYQRSNDVLEEEVTRTMQLTLKQAALNLTYKLNHIRDSSNSIFMNQILYDNLQRQDTITEQLSQIKELRNLAGTAQENGDVFRVRFYVDKSRLYGSDRINLYPLADMEQYPWYPAVQEAGGGIVWSGIYTENYIDSGEREVFSAARILRNPQQYEEIIGVLVLDMSQQLIAEIVSGLNFSEQYAPYLIDGSGNVIYSGATAEAVAAAEPVEPAAEPDAESVVKRPAKLPDNIIRTLQTSSEGSLKREEGGEELHLVYSSIGTTGWKLVAQVSKAEISHRATALNQFTSIAALGGITVMFLVLVFVLLMFMVQGMQRRVKLILRMIRKEGIGWLEDRRSLPDGDFRLLERSVDHLIHKVNNLMEDSYRAKIQEREAQLRTLQAQINPHFLYNALDMINWSAIAHDAEDTSQMIEALARYFRLSLNSGRDNVSIADELNLARVFLEIQQNRFPSTFSFTIEQEPGLEQYLIPKLTLQPLVENALLHGIRKSKGKQGTIRIRAAREQEDLLLTVADDGIGMSAEQAERLLLEPEPGVKQEGDSSFGLYNVHERIRYFAGERYGVSIETEQGKGTIIRIKVKAITED